MKFVFDGGDILVEGDKDELRTLARDLKWVSKHGGEEITTLMNEDGVSQFVIRRSDYEHR